MRFPFFKNGFNILRCPVRFLVEGLGSATEGKLKTFEKNAWLFFFQLLNARIKFFPQSQELKLKNPTKEKRKEVPDGNLEKESSKRGGGEKKKRTQAWDYRRMCRVLRRALNEKSFLQVWGPRVRPAEG